MRWIEPYFRLSHGAPRVDDPRVINGTIFVIRNSRRWFDALAKCGLHKTIYICSIHSSRIDVFKRAFASLPARRDKLDQPSIAANHLWAQRMAASRFKKGDVARHIEDGQNS